MMTYFLLNDGLISPLNLLPCNDFGKVYCTCPENVYYYSTIRWWPFKGISTFKKSEILPHKTE